MTAIYHTLSTLDYTCNSLAQFFSFFPKTDLHHRGTFYEASAAADAAVGHGADRHYGGTTNVPYKAARCKRRCKKRQNEDRDNNILL